MSIYSDPVLQSLEKINILPFYHHETIYKYIDLQGAIALLKNRTLKFSPVTEFNDPFELNTDLIDFSSNKLVRREMLRETFHKMPGTRKEKRAKLKTIKAEFFIDSSINAFNSYRDTIGIHCVTTNNTDSRMWGHYADKHRGVCIGFNFSSLIPVDEAKFFHVNYADKIQPLKYFKDKHSDIIAIFNWIYTKSHIWSYENEVRMVRIRDNGLFPFNPSLLTEIYYGVSTPPDKIIEINNIISGSPYSDVKSYQMFIDRSKFELGVNDLRI